ncbi:unnamed protein product [Rotaria sordida]|uniref:Uncharacterized protein n=1 Tax=Rotaria sordida TaxID=392033 RepID=A0A815CYM7_9BILA|nr:unnamed protein product [Rotaria sordida]CAF3793006.1 unnamed protein product [Rotaria sordida]
MSQNKITIENLTKEELVHMIYKKNELIEKQYQLIEKLNDLNKIQEENDKIDSLDKESLDTLLHKRSNTIIDTTSLSSEVSVQLSIDSPNESLTNHKEKIKSSGENCIIKNSIVCDNGLIRNSVQIDKECLPCKNVIIVANVHLNQRITIIASNSITSTTVIDEIEIDDDIEISSKKFISSSNEEIIISNSSLVGIVGFGKELIFNSVHDNQAEYFEDTDDNDKNQLNVFDAWCAIV